MLAFRAADISRSWSGIQPGDLPEAARRAERAAESGAHARSLMRYGGAKKTRFFPRRGLVFPATRLTLLGHSRPTATFRRAGHSV